MRKGKWKTDVVVCMLGAVVSWTVMLITVSYGWGYDQCAVDNHIAYFSYPPYVNLLNGAPWFLATIIFAVIAWILYKKARI